jgi:hypothetical protein
MARALRVEERRRLGEQALNLAALGMSNVAISDRIGVNRKTVPGLLRQAMEETDTDQLLELTKAKAHYRQIIKTCWTKLQHKSLSVNSHNVPAFIGLAANAQARLDKLNGVEAPIKHAHVHKTITEHARMVENIPREQRLSLVE